jgi:hypothetical protein
VSEHKDYSGTPLWRKLGITEGARVLCTRAPAGFADELQRLAPIPGGVEFLRRPGRNVDVAITFVTRRSDLTAAFPALARSLTPAGRLWIAWPKKAAGVRTDLDFDAVQRVGLDAGLVDNKSASITETYQGLQFVVRTRDRPASREP